jgi:hypothetical protein
MSTAGSPATIGLEALLTVQQVANWLGEPATGFRRMAAQVNSGEV